MFAVAFDLTVAEAERLHPKGYQQAYADIGDELKKFGFERTQGSVYLTKHEDLANLVSAMNALRLLPWFPAVVRDIRAFRVDQWSDFTPFMKEGLKKT